MQPFSFTAAGLRATKVVFSPAWRLVSLKPGFPRYGSTSVATGKVAADKKT